MNKFKEKKSLLINCPSILAAIDYNGKYQMPKHLILTQERLLNLAAGNSKRLIVNMPPRHGKSEMISKYFPAWYLLNYPEKRVILISYEADFAASWGRKIRDLCVRYSICFPNAPTINRLSNASNRFDFANYPGGLATSGIGGAITGKGADLMIIDDPIKNNEDALSATLRNKAWDWFKSTAFTRLEPDGKIVLIMTRWHYDDLVGKIINDESASEWERLCFPAFAGENDIIGRLEGDVLWGDRYSAEVLKKSKDLLGSYWFSAMYQQKPIASEYQILKPEWWQYYSMLPKGTLLIQSWDTAYKEKQENDYTVCTTWLLAESGFYLVDLFRKRLIFPDLKRELINQFNKHKPHVVIVEDPSGVSLIQVVNRETRIPIKPIPVAGKSKEVRAHLISPLLESGKVYLPSDAQYLADVVNECAEFPYGKHDDIVDSITQALGYLRVRFKIHNGQSVKNLLKPVQRETNVFSTY
jgi:predicted phage terminase large subunit-like protein